MAKFKTRQGAIIDDIKTYVANWIADKPEANIYIGCDSQKKDTNIDYAVSICIYNPGKGGHIINSNTTLPANRKLEESDPDKAILERLWLEVEMSVNVAQELKDLGRKITIHCDYSSDRKYISNVHFNSGLAYANFHGFEAEGKPAAWCSTHVADNAVR